MDIERWMKAASCFSLIVEKISRNSTERGETVDLCNIFKGLKLVVLAEQEMLITDDVSVSDLFQLLMLVYFQKLTC